MWNATKKSFKVSQVFFSVKWSNYFFRETKIQVIYEKYIYKKVINMYRLDEKNLIFLDDTGVQSNESFSGISSEVENLC